MAAAACALAAGAAVARPGTAHALAATPTPTVSLPPQAGTPWNAAPVDLNKLGFSEQEYFFSGMTSVGAFTSRMIVRRPADTKKFNGTVIVEWMNASSGSDIDVDFLPALDLITREGYAYVGVTAQAAPVNFLRKHDPARYGGLTLTDKGAATPAAMEVFSQAGTALRNNGQGVDPLGGLHAQRLIAIGQSQSSWRLTSYVNTVQGVTTEPVYDAFLLHSGGNPVQKFGAPTIKLDSESEAAGSYGQRNVSNPLYRYWSVAGTAHQPLGGVKYVLDLLKAAGNPLSLDCKYPYFGDGGPVPIDEVVKAAISHLDTWVRTGQSAAQAPLFSIKSSFGVNTVQRDKYGNALGGIRMPQQDVPTGRNVATGPGSCLGGSFPTWDAFDGSAEESPDQYTEPASAKALYGSHDGYVAKFTAATRATQQAGFILAADADRMIAEAQASDIAR